jgi:hypothetical protein
MADVDEKAAHPPDPLVLEEAARQLAEADGPKLATLGDVQRAMAAVCRRIRNGHLDVRQGNALTVALNTLHGMMRDARDSKHQKRLRVLWEAHQRGSGAAPEAEESEVQ